MRGGECGEEEGPLDEGLEKVIRVAAVLPEADLADLAGIIGIGFESCHLEIGNGFAAEG